MLISKQSKTKLKLHEATWQNSFTVSIVIIAAEHFTVKQLSNINSRCKFLIIYSELECTLYANIKKRKCHSH